MTGLGVNECVGVGGRTGLPRWVQTLLTAAVITPTGFLFSEPYEVPTRRPLTWRYHILLNPVPRVKARVF